MILLLIPVLIALVVGLSAFSGWVFMSLWNFAAPVFWPAAPHLTFYVAWAASFLIGCIGSALRPVVTVKRD